MSAATKVDLVVINDDSTKAECAEALGHMLYAARREMPVGRRFMDDPLTPYERRHQMLDLLLTYWQLADG